jgi:hypothetical protein
VAVFRVPLAATPQRFNLKLGGLALEVVSRWNGEEAVWVVDFLDADSGSPILLNLPLVTGGDLLGQFRHTALGAAGSLLVVTEGDALAPPSLTNLGAEGNLFFVTPEG